MPAARLPWAGLSPGMIAAGMLLTAALAWLPGCGFGRRTVAPPPAARPAASVRSAADTGNSAPPGASSSDRTVAPGGSLSSAATAGNGGRVTTNQNVAGSVPASAATNAAYLLAGGRAPGQRPGAGGELPPPAPGEIRPDVLLVDDEVLTIAEVLYPLRDELPEARSAGARAPDALIRLLRRQVQEEVGRMLIEKKAIGKLSEDQKKNLDAFVQRELDERVQKEFGNSHARLTAHLAEYGLTLDQYKRRLQRQFVVQQYTYENIRPQVVVRRDELLEYYQQRAEKMVTPGTRELFLIEAPFDKFLPAGVTWRSATDDARAAARLAATEQIRAAQADLATHPFEEVARARSRGLYAAEGGGWGPIGKPLTGAYAEVSKRLFSMSEGQVSEPIETETGWYIVKCGKVVAESRPGFVESQEKLREEFLNKRFNELASDQIIKLAEKAQISGLESFIREAVRIASDPAWPAGRYNLAPRGAAAVP